MSSECIRHMDDAEAMAVFDAAITSAQADAARARKTAEGDRG